MHAVYKDKYEKDMCEDERRVRKAAAAAMSSSTNNRIKKSPTLSAYSSFLSTFYPKFAAAKSSSSTSAIGNCGENRVAFVDDVLYEQVMSDCKLLFDNHFRSAIESLKSLENEHSQPEAVDSLRSMLNMMSSSV